ncbi:MAG: thiamine diphosphokinase [Lachnospiraceae bacterium]|nr:thiamine diphosphokinase [Lachnospiraceae bacterium]
MESSRDVIIVSGGSIDDEVLKNIFNEHKNAYIIGVDKGLDTLYRYGIKPKLAVGDFDSVSCKINKNQIYENCDNVMELNPEKDYTDTHVAIEKALELKPEHITILGATGGRLDHFLGNLNLLKICLDKDVYADIIDKQNRIRLINEKKELIIRRKALYGKYVSVIPFSDCVSGITLSGFKYNLSDASLRNDETLGISNELVKEEGLIKVGKGYLLVLETKD